MHHPEPWEVIFTSDFCDRPPTMTWRYPEPRALSAVNLVPLPLSTPVLVNTLNMGDEYQVRRGMLVYVIHIMNERIISISDRSRKTKFKFMFNFCR